MRRVRAAAKALTAQYYRAWNIDPFDPDLAMRRNRAWIRRKIRQGFEILDIGIDPDRLRRSRFHAMEKQEPQAANYPVARVSQCWESVAMDKNQFFEISAQQFAFLSTEHGFRHRARKTSGGTLLDIYQSQTTAVEVALEWHEQYVYVELCRLVDGTVKENPVIVRPDSELNCFNLENLLLVRAPAEIITPQLPGIRVSDGLEQTLASYAGALQKHAADVLQGDFSIFDELEALVKERAGGALEAHERSVSPRRHRGNGKLHTQSRSPLAIESHI